MNQTKRERLRHTDWGERDRDRDRKTKRGRKKKESDEKRKNPRQTVKRHNTLMPPPMHRPVYIISLTWSSFAQKSFSFSAISGCELSPLMKGLVSFSWKIHTNTHSGQSQQARGRGDGVEKQKVSKMKGKPVAVASLSTTCYEIHSWERKTDLAIKILTQNHRSFHVIKTPVSMCMPHIHCPSSRSFKCCTQPFENLTIITTVEYSKSMNLHYKMELDMMYRKQVQHPGWDTQRRK